VSTVPASGLPPASVTWSVYVQFLPATGVWLAPCNVACTGPPAATGVVAVEGLAPGAAAVVFAGLVELEVVFDFELPQATAPRSSATLTAETIVCLSL
jgi:hypothetical protein